MDDDSGFPDIPEPESDPTARGIVQCLRMLAEEAASLGMSRTLDALQAAIAVCSAEGETAEGLDQGDVLRLHPMSSSRLH